jgi:chromosome segregation ATPase
MSDTYDGGSPLVRNILIGAAVVWLVGSVIFMVMANNRINDMEQRQTAALKEMSKKMEDSNGQMRASISVVADRVGLTQKDLTKKAAILQAEENNTQTRLKGDEATNKQQFTAVNGAVDGVKGDLTKVSADVSDTKTDLATTKGKLETAIGDINKHSELIATSHDQLEQLRHRGDRDYLEFTLHKGKDPIRLSTVSLQLKKVDPKKGEFTLIVMADDKKIEKKDKNLNEPLQFYSGRDRNLFEVVINAAAKDVVSGYMSTPKNMAANVPPDPRAPTQQ